MFQNIILNRYYRRADKIAQAIVLTYEFRRDMSVQMRSFVLSRLTLALKNLLLLHSSRSQFEKTQFPTVEPEMKRYDISVAENIIN